MVKKHKSFKPNFVAVNVKVENEDNSGSSNDSNMFNAENEEKKDDPLEDDHISSSSSPSFTIDCDSSAVNVKCKSEYVGGENDDELTQVSRSIFILI